MSKLIRKAIKYYIAKRLNFNASMFVLTGDAAFKKFWEERSKLYKDAIDMAITDPITVQYMEKRKSYILVQGRETFYNDGNEMMEFDTPADAVAWCERMYGVTPIQDADGTLVDIIVEPDGDQLSMFGG